MGQGWPGTQPGGILEPGGINPPGGTTITIERGRGTDGGEWGKGKGKDPRDWAMGFNGTWGFDDKYHREREESTTEKNNELKWAESEMRGNNSSLRTHQKLEQIQW